MPAKSLEDIEAMRLAGRLASEVLDYITPHVKPGVTTGRLDKLCHDYMVERAGHGARAAQLRPARAIAPIPNSICTSVNHQVCHGVPGRQGAARTATSSTSTSP